MTAYQFPKKVVNLTPYEPITGTYPVRLDANESFIAPGEALRSIIQEAVGSVDFNRYPDPYADRLCRSFVKAYGIESQDFVVAGNGSDELISILVSGLFNKGEKILSLAPDFSMYAFYPSICEAQAVVMPKEEDLTIDVDKVIRFINENEIAALLFSNPCNPTSLGLPREEVIRLIDSVEALVIVDEAYMEFYGDSVLDLAGQKKNLIVLKTCSKAIGMAAIRLGFAVSTKEIVDVIKSVKSPYNVNSMSQAIGEELLGSRDYLDKCTEALIRSRDYLQRELDALYQETEQIVTVYKSDCNFITMELKDAPGVFEALKEQGIVVRCLNGKYLRVSAGSHEENRKFLAAFQAIVKGEAQ